MNRKHKRLVAKAKRLALQSARRKNRTVRMVMFDNAGKRGFVGVADSFEVNGLKIGPGAVLVFDRAEAGASKKE